MCSATLGATPVCRCTRAASAIFSYGSRGTPGCANTLNRVPELPNAQEGSSMCCRRSTSFTSSIAVTLRCDRDHLRAQQVRGGAQFRHQVADAERPVVRHPAGTPLVDPVARVAAEVDPG